MGSVQFPSYDLTGKRALVTGSGSGIGRAAAMFLAHYGARVIICDISRERAEAVVEEIRVDGGDAKAVQADVSDAESVNKMFCKMDELFGGIDILISNAGIGGEVKPILEQSEQAWDQVLSVNLKGAFLCGKQAAQRMIQQGTGGRVIFTSSIAAYEGGGFHGPYGAAKGGLCTLVRTMAHEWAPYKITVNAVCPGLTETAINQEISGDPVLKESFLAKIPLRRKARPEEIASLMLYLSTDAAAFITGTSMIADGGATIGG